MSSQPPFFKQRLQTAAQQLAQLPVPDADAQAHSEALIAHIRQAIGAAGGRISFARYMELTLFAPGLGYYSAGNQKFGAAGDFITAPELSPLFSRCLAHQCAQVLTWLRQQKEGASILEFGAGSGVMAVDILLELEHSQALPDEYLILELSADLQQRQRETLAQRVPHLMSRVHWLTVLPDSGFRGVMLANEVVDAMPVHRVINNDEPTGTTDQAATSQESPWRELAVTWHDGRFHWQTESISSKRLQSRLDQLPQHLPMPYTTEINLAQDAWVAAIGEMLGQGLLLVIDYGFPQHEYYHAQRDQGTLMCHYRHRAHDDPFVYPGLQDITAHVDFTALAVAAVQARLDVSGFCSQAQFLLSNGLQDMVTEVAPEDAAYADIARQVRTLTSPEQMGELFKVMALTRELPVALAGFQLRDQRNRL